MCIRDRLVAARPLSLKPRSLHRGRRGSFSTSSTAFQEGKKSQSRQTRFAARSPPVSFSLLLRSPFQCLATHRDLLAERSPAIRPPFARETWSVSYTHLTLPTI